MKYEEKTTLEELEGLPGETMIVYGVGTCWWGIKSTCCVYRHKESNLPCDPRSGMLFEGELGPFLVKAKENPAHYGKHELKAFMAAYHGNVTTDDDLPTCFQTWHEYNDLIDKTEDPSDD
jgi:hypothetical protein